MVLETESCEESEREMVIFSLEKRREDKIAASEYLKVCLAVDS